MSFRLETDKDISIDADLPSIDEKDFKVTVSDDRLMIRGERRNNHETKNKDEHLSKRSWAESTRQVLLPFKADPEKVSARLDKGVLQIAIPKTVTMPAYVATGGHC
jgi:HSP20 family protein